MNGFKFMINKSSRMVTRFEFFQILREMKQKTIFYHEYSWNANDQHYSLRIHKHKSTG